MPIIPELHEKIICAIAESLHYYDFLDSPKHKHNISPTCQEVLDSVEGGIKRYHHDVIFHARVSKLSSIIMQIIREAEEGR